MTHRYLHVGMAYAGTPEPMALIPWVSTVCDDWMRYGATNWVLWSNAEIDTVYTAIKMGLSDDDQFAIFRMDPTERHGWLSKYLWDWIDKPKVPRAALPTYPARPGPPRMT